MAKKNSDYTVSVNDGPEMSVEDFHNMLNRKFIPAKKTGQITKAKITKDKISGVMRLEVVIIESITDEEGLIENEVSKKMGYEVHPDLINAFNKLAFHCAIICDQIDVTPNMAMEDARLIFEHSNSNISVTGFVIGGQDDHEGITIIGRRALRSGKILNLIAPFTKWSDEHTPYNYEFELYEDFQAAELEAAEYMNGKHAPAKQLEIEFENQ